MTNNSEAYSYDKAGNITEYYEPGMMAEYFYYDTNNRLVYYAEGYIGYDADGNMVSGSDYCGNVSSFVYDSAKTNFSMDNNEIKCSFSIGIGLTIGVSW